MSSDPQLEAEHQVYHTFTTVIMNSLLGSFIDSMVPFLRDALLEDQKSGENQKTINRDCDSFSLPKEK